MTHERLAKVRLLTRREACDRLRIGLSQYKLLVGRGALHEIAVGARGRRLPESEIEHFVQEGSLLARGAYGHNN